MSSSGEKQSLLRRESSSSKDSYVASPQPPCYSQSAQQSDDTDEYRVYGKRWFMLLVVSLLNASNASIWIMFSPIANHTAIFYSVSTNDVNWLSLIYLVVFVPFGLCSAWIIDSIGLRFSIILSAWLNGVGAALHVVSALSLVNDQPSYPILLLGQGLAALAQPIAMAVPVKVAALWFGSNQRVLATTIGSLCNPLGIMIANLIAPQILDEDTSRMLWLMVAFAVIPVLTVLLATLGIYRSEPPTPPSRSAAEDSEPFFLGLKQLLKLPHFWLLCSMFGIGMGAITALSTLIQQILCPRGYSDKFSGTCGALFILFGLLLSPLIGLIVDRWKNFEEVTKICLAISTMSFIAFMEVSRLPDVKVYVGLTISLAGMFAFPLYPLSLELAIESSYPVSAGTGATCLLICGQVLGIVIILMMQYLAVPFPNFDVVANRCSQDSDSSGNLDFTYSNIAMVSFIALAAVVFTIFYRSDYRRMKSEQKIVAKKILNMSTSHRWKETS